MKRLLFGAVMLAIAGMLIALAWHELPDGFAEVRLPGRPAASVSLGQVPAMGHVLALGFFAAVSLAYVALALIRRSRFPRYAPALPAIGAFAASSMLTGMVANFSSSDGFVVSLAIVSGPVNSGIVLLFGYSVEGRIGGPRPRKRPRRADPPALSPTRKGLLLVCGLAGAAAAVWLFVIAVIALGAGRVMRLPVIGYALPGLPPVVGLLAALLLCITAVSWIGVLLISGRRSPTPLAVLPAVVVLGVGFMIVGSTVSGDRASEILLGFAVASAIAAAIGGIGALAARRPRRIEA